MVQGYHCLMAYQTPLRSGLQPLSLSPNVKPSLTLLIPAISGYFFRLFFLIVW